MQGPEKFLAGSMIALSVAGVILILWGGSHPAEVSRGCMGWGGSDYDWAYLFGYLTLIAAFACFVAYLLSWALEGRVLIALACETALFAIAGVAGLRVLPIVFTSCDACVIILAAILFVCAATSLILLLLVLPWAYAEGRA